MHLHLLFMFLSLLLLEQPTGGKASCYRICKKTRPINPSITMVTDSSFFVAKPGCQLKCGNITVPYPFGIGSGSGCSISSPWFDLNCSTAYDPPKLFLGELEVLNISQTHSQTQVRVGNTVAAKCYNQTGALTFFEQAGIRVGDKAWPYMLSDTNKFMVVGCDAYAYFSWYQQGHNFSTGCMSTCVGSSTDVVEGDCTGIGCCQINIPNGLKNFNSSSLGRLDSNTEVLEFAPCTYAFLGEENTFQFKGIPDLKGNTSFINRIKSSVPMVLDFVIGNQSCYEAQSLNSSSCQQNTICTDSNAGHGGYTCSCQNGYKGNPYLSHGCTDIDECINHSGLILNNCDAKATCKNTAGSFTCSCNDHYIGDGTYCIRKSFSVFKFSLGICFGLGVLLVLICLWWSRREVNRRKEAKLKKKFFKRNGGLLLLQQLSSDEGSLETNKLFTLKELEKATDNYNANRILGQGGQGTVYKGILSDGRTVAIKKSKVLDEGKLGQFINEVVILSRINHRNVVKLIGCCLETEVPMLVYEFISNGTLFDYIHDQNEEFHLTWDLRLRIATEIGGALSYLHSTASIPIYHRDIKSSNILLDERFRAKVSDFGISRSISVDKTHLTTVVQGTIGYLDPEYFRSSQFTEKSDVYSFGVVLVELLTGKRPILPAECDVGGSLTTYFLLTMEENRLFDILDARIVKEGSKEEIFAVAHVAKRCLSLSGKKRPTMKEVVMELDAIRMSNGASTAIKQGCEDIEYVEHDDLIGPSEVASNSTGPFSSTSLHTTSAV